MATTSQTFPELTWDQSRAYLRALANHAGEWAGIPMPLEGTKMVLDPRYPFAKLMSREPAPEREVPEDGELRNEWSSVNYCCKIRVWRSGAKFFVTFGRKSQANMLIETIGASRAWDLEAEIRAMSKLQSLIPDHLFRMYILSGMFLESSKRSGVFYIFRRLRPTVAMTGAAYGLSGRLHTGMKILCTLCAHPIGYYEGSWAGALCPTDDVISHLLLMRADEHFFWRKSVQHAAWEQESGL